MDLFTIFGVLAVFAAGYVASIYSWPWLKAKIGAWYASKL